jgi:protein O-mannosyl-transferase
MGSRHSRHTRATARAVQPKSPADRSTGLLLRAGLIVFVGVLTYWNSLSGPFLFDDQRSIVENVQIRRLWPLSEALSPPRETPVAGRPLVNLSFALNYALGGLDVRGYHLFNIAIHLISALILFGIVRRTLSASTLSERLFPQATNLAWVCALIWMLHPLQTESVSYLTERTESMMGLFYLLTLYCSVRAVSTARSGRWQVASVVSCALGMACKESMVTAPAMVMLYDRVFLFESVKESWRSRWRLYLGLAVTWLELAALMSGGPRASSVGFSTGVTPWTYLLNQTVMIAHYLRLALWPRWLVLDYGLPQALTLGGVMPAALVVTALLFVTLVGLAFRPPLGFLGAWFFIMLAPTSSVIPISTEVGAERRMYLSLAAIVVLAVVVGRLLMNRVTAVVAPAGGLANMSGTSRISAPGVWRSRDPNAGIRHQGVLSGLVVSVVCALLATGTILRNREYESALSMARTIVERRPHGRAHYMLGTELISLGGYHDEAMEHLREATRDYPGAHYALGTELVAAGRPDEGVEQLQEFIRLLPSHVNVIPAREMIGRVLTSQGKFDAAADQFRLLLKTAPSFVDAHGYLGDVLLAQKRFQDAILQYREFLKRRPTSARAHANLGLALAESGGLDEAIAAFQRAVEVDPQYVDPHRHLANAFLARRDYGRAAAHARRALEIKPDDAIGHNLLGLALASERHFDEAIAEFRQALQINSGYDEARRNLQVALRLRGNARNE